MATEIGTTVDASKKSRSGGMQGAPSATSAPERVVVKGAPSTDAPPAKRGRKSGPSDRGNRQRQKILEAAFHCFNTLGFDGATTRAIAQRAGISHTAVLYHFKSKDQLWIVTMEMAIADYINSIRDGLEVSGDVPAKDALQTFIREFVRFSAKSPGVHRMLSMESTQGTERLEWIIEHYLRDHFVIIRDLIRRGQTENTVREGDPARLYYFILSAGSAPFTLSSEYKALTGRDVFSETEIYQTIGFIYDVVFVSGSK